MDVGRRARDGELGCRLLGIGEERRHQRPGRRQLLQQERDPRLLVHGAVVGAGGGLDQLRDRALVDIGVLPQIHAGEMESEHLGRAPQRAQPPARQQGGAIGVQRPVEDVEIGAELGGFRIGLRFGDRAPRQRGLAERARRREQPRVDADDGAPIGLRGAARRFIGRALGEFRKLRRDAHPPAVERKLGPEQMQFVEIEVEDPLALHRQRSAPNLGIHEGIAVAVAADPASDPHERRQVGVVEGRIVGRELILDHAIEARQLAQEGVVVIGKTVRDLIDHVGPAAPQQAGLPERQHGAQQGLVAGGEFARRHLLAVALGQQMRDLHFAVEHALPAHLGRMRGQHRADEDAAEQVLQLCARHLGRLRASEGISDRAFARRRLQLLLGAGAADVVLVLRDVGEMREIREGAHDLDRTVARQAVEGRFQLRPRGFVIVAPELDRNLADAFDGGEHGLALLLADGIAKDATEQADVFAQRQIAFWEIDDVHDRPPLMSVHQRRCKKHTSLIWT